MFDLKRLLFSVKWKISVYTMKLKVIKLVNIWGLYVNPLFTWRALHIYNYHVSHKSSKYFIF